MTSPYALIHQAHALPTAAERVAAYAKLAKERDAVGDTKTADALRARIEAEGFFPFPSFIEEWETIAVEYAADPEYQSDGDYGPF